MVNPGDEIYILLDGKPYLTVMDEGGVQRFKVNSVLRYLVNSGIIGLNELQIAYSQNKFTLDDYRQFCMMIGYSVDGFLDLSFNQDLKVLNALNDTQESYSKEYLGNGMKLFVTQEELDERYKEFGIKLLDMIRKNWGIKE